MKNKGTGSCWLENLGLVRWLRDSKAPALQAGPLSSIPGLKVEERNDSLKLSSQLHVYPVALSTHTVWEQIVYSSMAELLSGMHEALGPIPNIIKKILIFRENLIIQFPNWHFTSVIIIQCKEVSTQNKGLFGRECYGGGDDPLSWYCQISLL